MKKRIGSLVLTLCMVLTLIPMAAVPAWAAESEDWAALQAAISSGTSTEGVVSVSDGTVTLLKDITSENTDSGLTVSASTTVTIDLNGHTIKRKTYRGSVISVSGSLTLKDSGGSGKITGGVYEDGYGGGVNINSGGTFKMTGGTITGNTAENGGGVAVYNGTFEMTGGRITGNNAYRSSGNSYDGGGVYVAGNGIFKLSGNPVISGNYIKGTADADGVYTKGSDGASNNVYWSGSDPKLQVIGELTDGADIHIAHNDTSAFTNSADISLNDVTKFHADVSETYTQYGIAQDFDGQLVVASFTEISSWKDLSERLSAYTKFRLTADIEYTSSSDGDLSIPANKTVILDLAGHKIDAKQNNKICIKVTGKLALNDSSVEKTGQITGSKRTTETNGCGVLVDGDSAVFTMNSGKISGNSTTGKPGGGVYINNGTFNMNGGEISGNYTAKDGGGVYVSNAGIFNMNGGTITGNSADQNGGGVFVAFSSTNQHRFNISGDVTISGNVKGGSKADGATVYSGGDADNVYLLNNSTAANSGHITVTGPLTGDGKIGVTVSAPASYAQITNTESGNLAYNVASKFESDNSTYSVYKNDDGQLELAAPMTWSSVQTAMNSAAGGTIKLTNSITAANGDNALQVPANKTVILDLNGFTIDRGLKNKTAVADGYVIKVVGTLTVKDSSSAKSGKITGGNSTNGDGGGVYVNSSGTFTMNGGKISDNIATYGKGGGVYSAGTFNMYSGKISNNTANIDNGGGVYSTATFRMYGGEIDGNKAARGGGVTVGNSGEFTMESGTIKDNTATSAYGGGVYNSGTFTMGSGTISGNSASSDGGGVYNSGTFTMNGGEISGNTATSGGGIYMAGGTFTMSGGTITRNSTTGTDSGTGNGGGVNAFAGTFTMSGGEISNNTANRYGGGAEVKIFTMSGGTISNNTANVNGGGVFVDGDGTGNLKVEGGPTISGNKVNGVDNNVHLFTNTKITVTGPLSNMTPIGVAMNTPGVFTNSTTTSYNVAAKFSSDLSGYEVKKNTNDQLELAVAAMTWGSVQAAINNATSNASTTITLTNGITATNSDTALNIPMNKDITLDLAGYTIDRGLSNDSAKTSGNVITVNNGKLTVKDSSTNKTGKITGGNNSDNGGGVYVSGVSSFTLESGSVIGNKTAGRGGGVSVSGNAAVFNMTGGSVSDNLAQVWGGGGVYVETGKFNLSGDAAISGNSVEVASTTRNDGAACGGGVCLSVATMNMTDGTISGNSCKQADRSTHGAWGGGVFVNSSSTFNMSGGSITGNNAAAGTGSNGGGVFDNGTFKVSGNPSITGNVVGGSKSIDTYTGGTANNVYLNDKTITNGVTVDSTTTYLTTGASIGVTTATKPAASPVTIVVAVNSTHNNATVAGYFTSDEGYAVSYDETNHDIELNAYTVTINSAENGTVTADKEYAAAGETVTLTSTAGSGYVFGALSVTDATDNEVTVTSNQFTMPASNVTVSATFEAAPAGTYAVNIDGSITNGTVTASASSAATGTEITLTATPNSGYELSAWSVTKAGGGSVTVADNKFTMPDEAVTVSATFEAVASSTHSVTISPAANGSVTASPTSAASGETVTLTVMPASGHELDALTVTDADSGSVAVSGNGSTRTFTMPAKNVTVTATFKVSSTPAATYTVTVSPAANGSVTASPTSADSGETVTLTVMPDDGYQLGTLTVADAGSNPVTVTGNNFTMPASNVTVTATFELIGSDPDPDPDPDPVTTYTVSFDANGGTGSMADVTAPAGSYTLPANGFTPPASKTFDKWDIDGVKYAVGSTYTLTADTTLVAQWADAPAPVVVDSDDYEPSVTITAPVSGDENTVNVTVSVTGTAATLRSADIGSALSGNDETGDVVIDVSALGQDITSITIPAKTVAAIAEAVADGENSTDSLTVKLTDGTVTFDAAAVAAIAGQTGSSSLKLNLDNIRTTNLKAAQRTAVAELEVESVYDAYMTANGKRITDFKGGSATVTVTYALKEGQVGRGVVVWYVAEDGAMTAVPTVYDDETVRFTIEHFSNYVVAYDDALAVACPQDETCPIAAFTDTDPAEWYHDGVHYVLENGIMSGYGNGLFGPNDATSRAMMAQILWNLEGKPVVDYALDFSDVAEEWYAEALRWAASQGVMEGYGGAESGAFGPNDPVTREQVAVILYRYAQSKGEGFTGLWAFPLDFPDAEGVSDWAYESLCWMTMKGIIEGKDTGLLDPQGPATRAEIATMLMRFCKREID